MRTERPLSLSYDVGTCGFVARTDSANLPYSNRENLNFYEFSCLFHFDGCQFTLMELKNLNIRTASLRFVIVELYVFFCNVAGPLYLDEDGLMILQVMDEKWI